MMPQFEDPFARVSAAAEAANALALARADAQAALAQLEISGLALAGLANLIEAGIAVVKDMETDLAEVAS